MNRAIRTPELAAMILLAGLTNTSLAIAAPAQFTIDPQHTYPSFEASHMGISMWRGKFDKTTGTASFDEAAGRGVVDISVDPKSVDFGLKALNDFMVGPDFFDVVKFPESHYHGTLTGFVNGAPTRVEGALTLHGVTNR